MQPLGGNNAQALEERAQLGQRDVRDCCRDISLQPKKKTPHGAYNTLPDRMQQNTCTPLQTSSLTPTQEMLNNNANQHNTKGKNWIHPHMPLRREREREISINLCHSLNIAGFVTTNFQNKKYSALHIPPFF
jgi:hypothetical protein